jgi:CBS domain-containing protein
MDGVRNREERDLTGQAKTVAELKAKDVMTRHVLSVKPDWPLEQLADFLVRHSISGAPVTSDTGELIGVVSLTDIARAATISEEDLSAGDRHEYYSRILDDPFPAGDVEILPTDEHSQLKVQEIMTPVVIDVSEDAPVTEVAAAMIDGQVHRLFVTRDDKIQGIITTLDMLKVIRDQ